MTARIIDGKAFAEQVREKVAAHVARLKADHGITPGLAVVLVGEDPAGGDRNAQPRGITFCPRVPKYRGVMTMVFHA